MAKRDPNRTARNRVVKQLKAQRRSLLQGVFSELKDVLAGRYCKEASLNAFIGGKAAEYIDLKQAVIKTPMGYVELWAAGLKEKAKKSQTTGGNPRHTRMLTLLEKDYPNFKKYTYLFLKSSFLKHYDEHYKNKPKIDEGEYWFGQNNDEYGLLVTPRFVAGKWENDKSEIRRFKHPYWTIAHILETGLCYMREDKIRRFSQVDDYLQFFRDLVRRTKSIYQLQIADSYLSYVRTHYDPPSVPLLIPELRYDSHKTKHIHRLDFLTVNPFTMEKFGCEISPWSTHGKLVGAKKKLKEHNAEAKANFEQEMRKHKRYWRKYGIAYLVYTDEDLQDMNRVWNEIRSHLEKTEEPRQLELDLFEEFFVQ